MGGTLRISDFKILRMQICKFCCLTELKIFLPFNLAQKTLVLAFKLLRGRLYPNIVHNGGNGAARDRRIFFFAQIMFFSHKKS
jgi:hypothetical protein